jgi:glycosyltransferase involved in cell wall biosynthesis
LTPREIRLAAYTDAETAGGAERCLTAVLAGLPPSFRVMVVATDAAVAEAVADGCGAAEIALVEPPARFYDAGAVRGHRRALRRLRPELCIINLRTPYAALHATVAALLVPRLRVVAVEHSSLPSRSRAARSLKRMSSRRLAAHIAVSERTAETVAADAGLPAGRLTVVPNGVAEPAGAASELGLRRPVVGAVGRLDRLKGFDVLVDALAQLPGVTAVIAGDGPARAALVQRARERGVADRLEILGWQQEIGPFLRSLDVFALPSRLEGLPLSLLEAMATRTAVVATDVGGIGEAVASGETGLLVPPDDASALADAIRRLLDDDDLRERVVARAHEEWVARFTEQRMQERYAELLTALARRP